MALVHCNFQSEALGLCTSLCAVLPATRAENRRGRRPTLYLLHGLSDDHTIWQRRTSIERYAIEKGLAVVMPAAGRSFYTDMAAGLRYWTFISEELPAIAGALFPVSDKRENTFVAGLSMGGYGAFKLAFRRPEKFAAASLSGVMDVGGFGAQPDGSVSDEFRNIFGPPEKIRGSDNDLFHLAERCAASDGPKPKLYQCCGTSDFLLEQNARFRDHAKTLGLDLTYEEGPGHHEWGYWDRQIQRVIDWLPL